MEINLVWKYFTKILNCEMNWNIKNKYYNVEETSLNSD